MSACVQTKARVQGLEVVFEKALGPFWNGNLCERHLAVQPESNTPGDVAKTIFTLYLPWDSNFANYVKNNNIQSFIFEIIINVGTSI
jgi:hypothetical protein